MQELLNTILPQAVFAYLLILTRLGSIMVLLPGIGEVYISPRIRMGLAVIVSFAFFPLLSGYAPSIPETVPQLVFIILAEAIVGLFIGIVCRIILTSLEIAGMVISTQMGVSAAVMFNPVLATQGSLISVLLTLAGIEMMFLMDMHHLYFYAMQDSYQLFPVNRPIPFEDMSASISKIVSETFRIAVQMSAPFLVMGIVFFTGMGLLSRLMPQMQIFFIAMPVQIMLGLILLSVSVSAILLLYLDFFTAAFRSTFLVGG